MPPWAGAIPAVVLVGGLSLLSLWGLIGRSLRPGALIGASWGTDAWRSVLSDPRFWDAATFTLRTALIATALSVLIAIPLGRVLRFGSPSLRTLTGLQIPVPHLVVAALAVAWVGPGGLADRLFGVEALVADRFGWGVIVVYVVKEVPFLTLLVATAHDPDSAGLEEAIRGLGGGRCLLRQCCAWSQWVSRAGHFDVRCGCRCQGRS